MGLTGIPPASFMRQGNPDDPRSTRTRETLIATYERQLATGSRTRSVAALTRAAGVSRSAFYHHFEGVEDLGVAALRQFLDGFGSTPPTNAGAGADSGDSAEPKISSPATGTASIEDLVEYIGRHRALCATVLNADEMPSAYMELTSALIEHLTSAISEICREASVAPSQAATFLVGGIMSVLAAWLSNPGETPEGVSSTIHSMLPDWMRNAKELRSPIQISS